MTTPKPRLVGLNHVALEVGDIGEALRFYRATILQYGWSNSWLWVAGTFLGQLAILFLLATLYLGNFHAKSWLWRAPLFAALEVGTEVAVSYLLLRAGLETAGSLPATFDDWQRASIRIVTFRMIGIPLFALVLAMGRMNAVNLGLRVDGYDPTVHYDQVKGKMWGLRTPDGR